ncbi:MAG: ribokinase [Roseibium sp.]|uniref:ribokinase n=1 Tax=Roseibium sp. TaxID=1936156 RepID=UPI001B041905|nr:ribokinase [Roseibium sp.]MBO6890367.1 ribokinase [Roseibium sp.]MBO6929192.1 ribokinase [Roseibium sp.]
MITVFGSINLDLVVAVPRLPTAGETVAGCDHQTFAGGKGANQALAARRAGAEVAMVGAVGNDAFSELALANMNLAGVNLSNVRSLDGATGLALIGVDTAGENQIIVASGANSRVEAAWLQEILSEDTTLMLQGEVPFPETERAMAQARQAGASVFWNPAPVPAGGIAGVLEDVDTLVVNESEAAEIAAHLSMDKSPEAFVEGLSTEQRAVVVTLGAEGVIACKGTSSYRLKAPVIEPVDTTGAGDAFCGALAAAIDANAPFERALKEGVAAGALACTVTGAQSSAPDKTDIDRLADQIF